MLIGRKDRQIKINGIRIELEEIENVLVKLKEIESAAVILYKNENRYISILLLYSNRRYM